MDEQELEAINIEYRRKLCSQAGVIFLLEQIASLNPKIPACMNGILIREQAIAALRARAEFNSDALGWPLIEAYLGLGIGAKPRDLFHVVIRTKGWLFSHNRA